MKTLKKTMLILLLTIPFYGCDKDSLGCDCVKTVERLEQFINTVDYPLPRLDVRWITISDEIVPCQEEQYRVDMGDNLFFSINCN